MLLSDGRTTSLAPQAYSETSPVSNQGYFVAKGGLSLEMQYATYAHLYKVQPWVAVVVNKIANLIARLGVGVWNEPDEGGKSVDTAGPYAKLIAKPCPTMDPYSFWLWVAATFEIYGEAFVLKQRDDNGRTTGLIPMHPSLTEIIRDTDGRLKYRFMGQPNETFDESEVIPFRSYNPDGSTRGWSRLEPLRSTLMNEDSSRRATSSWWKNMGRPSMVLSTDKKLEKPAKDRLRESFDSVHAGSGKVGGTVVLSDGVTATQMQLNAEEMQYIESRKLNREEVCAVYDISPSAVHILDNATYSNITEGLRSVYRDTMMPRLEFIESVLDTYLGSEFNGARYARFNVAAVLRGDFEARAVAIAPLVQSGVFKPSEARELFDLNDAGEVADRLYANAAIQPLGNPAERLSGTFAVGGTTTPDGVPITQVPSTIPGAPPTAVPAALPTALPVHGAPLPDPKVQKHIRSLNGAIGSGKTMQDAGFALAQKYPDELEQIQAACLQVLGRKL
ncbi:phage portal protein [Rhodococcus sp. 5A-K4]|uniref:phage portal protein n=1 Tax=Rhodococcus sp. 5A-K4 TaxID=3384442 RepID=UPI0038D39557